MQRDNKETAELKLKLKAALRRAKGWEDAVSELVKSEKRDSQSIQTLTMMANEARELAERERNMRALMVEEYFKVKCEVLDAAANIVKLIAERGLSKRQYNMPVLKKPYDPNRQPEQTAPPA